VSSFLTKVWGQTIWISLHAGFIEIRRGRTAGAYVVDQLYKPFYHSTTDLLRSGKIEIRRSAAWKKDEVE